MLENFFTNFPRMFFYIFGSLPIGRLLLGFLIWIICNTLFTPLSSSESSPPDYTSSKYRNFFYEPEVFHPLFILVSSFQWLATYILALTVSVLVSRALVSTVRTTALYNRAFTFVDINLFCHF